MGQKRNTGTYWACLLASGFWLLTSVFPASAQDITAQLAEEKAKHAVLEQKAAALNAEVKTLKSRLVEASATLRQTEANISGADRKLKDLHAKEAACTEKLAATQKALGGLVTAAQKFNRMSTSDLLLQNDPIDAARASLVMRAMIPALKGESDNLKSQLENIADIKKTISDQQSTLAAELKKHNEQQETLQQLLNQRQGVYAQTEIERRTEEQAVRQLAEKARNLEELVSKINTKKRSAAPYHLPTSMLLPVRGDIDVGFGEKDSLGGLSKGITFRARRGASVVTPLPGKVKFAGPFQKYRQILIIEHRGGYHSLIAGLGRIDTVVGASLDAGEPVGAADGTAPETRVYYELRQNGDPVNPQKLLAQQLKQDRS